MSILHLSTHTAVVIRSLCYVFFFCFSKPTGFNSVIPLNNRTIFLKLNIKMIAQGVALMHIIRKLICFKLMKFMNYPNIFRDQAVGINFQYACLIYLNETHLLGILT